MDMSNILLLSLANPVALFTVAVSAAMRVTDEIHLVSGATVSFPFRT